MNYVFLVGNLSADPQPSTTPNGVNRCTFRLATQRKFVNQQTGKRDADFHNIVTWRQLADICTKYLHKGSKCAVIGTLQYRSYTGQDGKTHYVTEVVAEEIKLLDGKTQQGAPQGEYIPPSEYTPVEPDELPF